MGINKTQQKPTFLFVFLPVSGGVDVSQMHCFPSDALCLQITNQNIARMTASGSSRHTGWCESPLGVKPQRRAAHVCRSPLSQRILCEQPLQAEDRWRLERRVWPPVNHVKRNLLVF